MEKTEIENIKDMDSNNDMVLYHVTPEENYLNIIKNGFDLSKSSSNGIYGKGIYFFDSIKESRYFLIDLKYYAYNMKPTDKLSMRLIVANIKARNKYEFKLRGNFDVDSIVPEISKNYDVGYDEESVYVVYNLKTITILKEKSGKVITV